MLLISIQIQMMAGKPENRTKFHCLSGANMIREMQSVNGHFLP